MKRPKQPSREAVAQQQVCSAGEERKILVTVYIYDFGSKVVNVKLGHVMRDLDCSYFAPCELKQRFFTIGTDARATDEQCVDRFIAALKASGVDIGKHEWSTLPNDKLCHAAESERGAQKGQSK